MADESGSAREILALLEQKKLAREKAGARRQGNNSARTERPRTETPRTEPAPFTSTLRRKKSIAERLSGVWKAVVFTLASWLTWNFLQGWSENKEQGSAGSPGDHSKAALVADSHVRTPQQKRVRVDVDVHTQKSANPAPTVHYPNQPSYRDDDPMETYRRTNRGARGVFEEGTDTMYVFTDGVDAVTGLVDAVGHLSNSSGRRRVERAKNKYDEERYKQKAKREKERTKRAELRNREYEQSMNMRKQREEDRVRERKARDAYNHQMNIIKAQNKARSDAQKAATAHAKQVAKYNRSSK